MADEIFVHQLQSAQEKQDEQASGKNGKQRVIPITAFTAKELTAFMSDRTAGALFTSRKGSNLTPRQINRIVEAAGFRSGVNNPNPKYRSITPHLLRHTFARLWKAESGSIETLAAILGHESTRTTWDTYGKEGLSDIRDNYQRTIQRMLKQPPEPSVSDAGSERKE